MRVSTQDMFGDSPRAEPATPGSYGEAPRRRRLPDAASVGAVHLQIADLDRSVAYYNATLGLRVVRREVGRVALAAYGDDRVLVELHEQRRVRPAGRGRLGLYHFAILLPDRSALGRFVRHLGEHGARAGAADHLASEAFYLTDPDGLGIEVYADRPRSTWQRIGRELMLATDPIDLDSLLAAAGDAPWTGMPAGTVMGHVHLHVGDLAAASDFYSEGLGFDRMIWRYPGALFLGAGGYHHHVGVNTWAGPAARPARDDDARLLEWTLELPDADAVAAVGASMRRGGHGTVDASGDGYVVRDPWGTAVRVRAPR